jgi:anaerobic magnesium-protoporphyrin IX monomethyl ester cyclase
MVEHPVVFVAFQEFDNLGVGYVASMLSVNGYKTHIIDFRNSREEILELIRRENPQVVGFSVIFQYHIYEFRDLIDYLRNSGITSHFSAGGQFASMRYEDLFNLIPSLDSIVRFEGEYTFLEVVTCIHSGSDWRKIKGLAFKENGTIKVTPLRLPEMDLDKFPFPVRTRPGNFALDRKFSTLIVGRGCINNCSFCNNTEYIRQSLVPFRRLRKPELVVEEIDFLYHKKDCSVFLFEDDDFPVKTNDGSDWTERFCRALKKKKLVKKIIWKINCRPDEVDFESFKMMKDHGLFLTFLGIDDGTDCGLARLNKHMKLEDSLRGISTLKDLEIGFDYGFMLFQPASSFKSVNDNLDFLRQLCRDGYTSVSFLKTEPFFDTRIEKELRKEGRLNGIPGFSDYDFLISSLDHYYRFVSGLFMEWINDSEGVSNIIRWARNYYSVFSYFYKMTSEVQTLWTEIRKTAAQSNIFVLDSMMELSHIFETGKNEADLFSNLAGYAKNVKEGHDQFREQLVKATKKISSLAESQRLYQLIKF